MTVRAKMPFFGDDLTFKLDADTTGELDVLIEGSAVIDLRFLKSISFGALVWLPDSVSGSTRLEIDDDEDYPFEGELTITVGGNDVGSAELGLGPAGGRFCLFGFCMCATTTGIPGLCE